MHLSTVTTQAAPPGQVVPRRVGRQKVALRLRLSHFLMVAGPGLIVMVADNDAGAISTYTEAGARYGTSLLWVMVMLLPVTYFVQEMVARLGIATGEGLAAIIYERFGVWWGRFCLIDLLAVNFLTLVTEFAAVALAAKQLGFSPSVVVPMSAIGLILLVGTGSYRRWERMTLLLCGLNLAWLGLAGMVRPDWGAAAFDSVVPTIPSGGLTGGLVFLVVAIVGTTIAPWQLFFQQSCVADKRLRFADLKAARFDTAIGAVAISLFAGCMMLIGDAMFRGGLRYEDPAQMASALEPLIGRFGRVALLLLMLNAAVLGATAISLSSAWAWGEVMGWKNTLQARLSEAPGFLFRIRGVHRRGGRPDVDPGRTAAGDHPVGAGAGRGDAAGRDRVPAVVAQRRRDARCAFRQPAVEQRGELDGYHGVVWSFVYFGRAGANFCPPGRRFCPDALGVR